MVRGLSRLSVAVLLAASVALAIAQDTARNVLQKVDVAAAGDQVTVRMSFSEPLKTIPSGFSVANPNRIVLDFPATDNALQSQDLSTARGYVKNVRVAQTDARMRVVLNLDRQATYQSTLDGKDLVLTLLSPNTVPLAKKDEDANFQPAKSIAKLVGIKDLSFRRGVLGEGRVVIDLDDPSAGVDIKKQGATLIVEFAGATAPDSLLKKNDVTDFNTPVLSVTASKVGADRVRIEARQNPGANWEHLAYQTDTQFVLEVKPVSEDISKLGSGVGRFTGERMSLRFRDYPVREVLQAFSDFSSFNMVISDAVSGTITLNLQDVPWDQAMDIILRQKNLDMERQGNVIMIAPKDELIARAKSNQEALVLEPVRDAIFQLSFLSAKSAKIQLEEYMLGYSNTGVVKGAWTGQSNKKNDENVFIMAESNTNKLFVRAPESWLNIITRVIKEFDVPPRQVMIEARIVEAREGFSNTLGARLGYKATGAGSFEAPGNSLLKVAGSSTGFSEAMNSPLILPTGTGAMNFLLANAAQTRTLSLELNALTTDSGGKEISSPRVLSTNGQESKIEDGQDIPFQQATSSGATSVSFKKATLSLSVTPTINADGRVALDIKLNKDSPGDIVPGGVAINTKNVLTKVVVDNGGTVIVGGIYTESSATSNSGVPFLKDLPLIGWLFKTQSKQTGRKELLVFITPRVVTDQMVVN